MDISDLTFRIITQGKKVSIRNFELDLPSSSLELSRCEIDLTPTSDTAKIMDYALSLIHILDFTTAYNYSIDLTQNQIKKARFSKDG